MSNPLRSPAHRRLQFMRTCPACGLPFWAKARNTRYCYEEACIRARQVKKAEQKKKKGKPE